MSFLSRIFSRPADPEPLGDATRIAEVEATLTRLRPMLHADGGDVRIVSISEDGEVLLAWQGACTHCAVSEDTLGLGLAPALQADHEWVRKVRVEGT